MINRQDLCPMCLASELCDCQMPRVTFQEFLAQVNWDALSKEETHLSKTAQDYPEHEPYCKAKIARIQELRKLK